MRLVLGHFAVVRKRDSAEVWTFRFPWLAR